MNSSVSASPYALSPMQAGMLFQSLYSSKAGVDIEQLVCSFAKVNISRLEFAWQQIWQTNEILRTGFDWFGLDQPVQRIHEELALPWQCLDWRNLSDDPREKLENFLRQDRQAGFKLNQPPLMRLTLIQVKDHNYWLIWTFHHILLDGRAIPIIFRQMAMAYQAQDLGKAIVEQPLHPYRDYIAWLEEQDLSSAKAYWQELLRGVKNSTPLGISHSQLPLPEGKLDYGVLNTYLSAELTQSLRQLAEQHSLTLNTLLQGAWAILLNRYSREQDIVFGSIRTCRHSALEGQGLEEMIGLLINTLPVRIQIDPEAPVLQILKDLRAHALELRGSLYEHVSLAEIQKLSELQPGSRLFDTILAYENSEPNETLKNQHRMLEKWDFELLENAGYPLVVAAYSGKQLKICLEYSRGLFDTETGQRILGHLQTLLKGITEDPACPAYQLPILTEAERSQILFEWNNTQATDPGKCIHALIEEQAQQAPDNIAVVLNDTFLTYRELNQRANQLAHYLRASGIGPSTHVAVCTERSLEMIVYLLAVLKSGGVYIPLDPDYPADRLAFMLEDAEVQWLLTQPHLLNRFSQLNARILFPEALSTILSKEKTENLPSLNPEQAAYILYTSGSTGKPKGVVISHASLATHVNSVVQEYQMTAKDRMLQFASISFDTAMEQIFDPLVIGAAIVLRSGNSWSIDEFRQNLLQYGLTIIELPPLYLHELLLDWAERPMAYSANTLRIIFTSGEKISPQTVRLWKNLAQKQIKFLNSYGPTETTIGATLFDLSAYSMPPTVQNIPIGRPLPGRTMYILDEYVQPVPVGIAGELYIGGTGVAKGYFKRPELTAEKFIPNPFGEGRVYRTGDLVSYLPDGNLEFLGRVDSQVKIRGFRVELGEIETVIRQLPSVQEAVVIVRAEANRPEQLVAYLTIHNIAPEAKDELTLELRDYLKKKLPGYMLPSAYVVLERFPVSPNGKIDRQALPSPESSPTSEEHFVPPQTVVEKTLAGLWAEILGVEKIGINDNFFDLGGHSLLATRLFVRLRDAFGLELPLRLLFETPTIAELAKRIENLAWAAQQNALTENNNADHEEMTL
jgi:surfactin family lipopeptide synthetase C